LIEIEYVSETELNLAQIKKIEAAIELYLEPNLLFNFIRKKHWNAAIVGN
jgi:phenylacetate-CoA ligase